MALTPSHRFTAAELISLANRADASLRCTACASLQHPGWEAMPVGIERHVLVQVGTLRDADVDEPTLTEYHPDGTHGWSPDAPIAIDHFPYNRCEVWQCSQCRRAYLRYTEYGGYYEEQRVRAVDPARVVRAAG